MKFYNLIKIKISYLYAPHAATATTIVQILAGHHGSVMTIHFVYSQCIKVIHKTFLYF